MTYIEKTSIYNERRYGKPWMAIVTTSLTRDFAFLDWDGRPGHAGEFTFEAKPGTLLAYGQKDIRKGRGGVDGYRICMPDGSLPGCSASAMELRKMSHEQRWRTMAQKFLDAAMARPSSDYAAVEWAKTRNADSARYSAMLGIDDPIMIQTAEAFGLVDTPQATSAAPDMSAFGL